MGVDYKCDYNGELVYIWECGQSHDVRIGTKTQPGVKVRRSHLRPWRLDLSQQEAPGAGEDKYINVFLVFKVQKVTYYSPFLPLPQEPPLLQVLIERTIQLMTNYCQKKYSTNRHSRMPYLD